MSERRPRWWLRQVAVLAADRDRTTDAIVEAFGLAVCHRADAIDGYAMANALLPVADRFLEVATPLDATSPAARRLARRGEGGYLVVLQTDDIEAARTRAEAAGASVTIDIEQPGARELHLHPATTGGVALALDAMSPETSWRWAGEGWRDHARTGVVRALLGVTIEADDHAAVAARWCEVLGREARRGADGTVVELDQGTWLRFVHRAGAAAAMVTIHLQATAEGAARSVDVGSCRITTG